MGYSLLLVFIIASVFLFLFPTMRRDRNKFRMWSLIVLSLWAIYAWIGQTGSGLWQPGWMSVFLAGGILITAFAFVLSALRPPYRDPSAQSTPGKHLAKQTAIEKKMKSRFWVIAASLSVFAIAGHLIVV